MIEKVFGINATSVTLNARFTLLAETLSSRVMRPRKRLVSHPVPNISYNLRSQKLHQQIAYHFQQSSRQRMKQRLGLRRYRSASSLPGLRRANSTGNINQGVKTRLAWTNADSNLRWASPFNNTSGMWRGSGIRLRNARIRLVRGGVRGRGGRQQMGQLRGSAPPQQRRARGARGGRARGGRARGQTRGRGRGRGATTAKKVPTKEELDTQLEHYMANSQWALDKQLDDYMKDAVKEE
ncbi:chromatin target of PRMT1 protein-like [Pieris napi]|uniref:chromatin target of PRMT1 protein-like n=1 Tax=Pieris napi TaxID=78633 RepID=UPI001FBB7AEB|nr:chromatin target of PRMT1 protein-like [Pieris napi]